jgi:hypothetical protein
MGIVNDSKNLSYTYIEKTVYDIAREFADPRVYMLIKRKMDSIPKPKDNKKKPKQKKKEKKKPKDGEVVSC